jgi:hypothetical protein
MDRVDDVKGDFVTRSREPAARSRPAGQTNERGFATAAQQE